MRFLQPFQRCDIATLALDGKALVRLFNPRKDLWNEHFRIDGIEITGITTVGQATAMLLRFNDADRLLEREILIAIGRFPSVAARQRITKRQP